MHACMYACMHLCMDTCMHVCMYGCMHLCMDAWMHGCMYAGMCACMYACMDVCIYAWMHGCMYAGMQVCMHACMHVWMYAFMHGCMDACIHVCMYAGMQGMYACMYIHQTYWSNIGQYRYMMVDDWYIEISQPQKTLVNLQTKTSLINVHSIPAAANPPGPSRKPPRDGLTPASWGRCPRAHRGATARGTSGTINCGLQLVGIWFIWHIYIYNCYI